MLYAVACEQIVGSFERGSLLPKSIVGSLVSNLLSHSLSRYQSFVVAPPGVEEVGPHSIFPCSSPSQVEVDLSAR